MGCEEIILKYLSPNQDNEKNQIYFGPNLTLVQYFPGVIQLRKGSTSTTKNRSKAGSPIVASKLDFSWLWPDQEISAAPQAKIIEYSQYPEVRFSGFHQGSIHSPRALLKAEQHNYGQRVLALGISGEKTFGAVLTDVSSAALISELKECSPWEFNTLFQILPTGKPEASISSGSLIKELRELAGIQHSPVRLKRIDEPLEPINQGGQAGGWTLEALLGIAVNSKREPDKYGFEIKAVGSSRISLITTEPDLGFKAKHGLVEYLNTFGRPAQSGINKRVFSGVHKCGVVNSQTGALLSICHWDHERNQPNGEGQPDIHLTHVATGKLISGWTFKKVGDSWTKKHAGAVYVETKKIAGGYIYGPRTVVGKGTSALRFLQQVSTGAIFLDPGDSNSPSGGQHARTQWRINGNIQTTLLKRLTPLYENISEETLF